LGPLSFFFQVCQNKYLNIYNTKYTLKVKISQKTETFINKFVIMFIKMSEIFQKQFRSGAIIKNYPLSEIVFSFKLVAESQYTSALWKISEHAQEPPIRWFLT